MGDIREPIRESAIIKKERIIEKGFELMCEKGYHNVNCIDIAKYASVSTGIIYQYFNDKRDIFIAGIKNYFNSIMFPMLDTFESNISVTNLESVLSDIIDSFIDAHKISYRAHEELMSMSHIDPEIKNIFSKSELELTDKIVSSLKKNGFVISNIKEKVHIVIRLVDNFCHEVVYHDHDNEAEAIGNTQQDVFLMKRTGIQSSACHDCKIPEASALWSS